MNLRPTQPPELCSISLCDKSLDFQPLTKWPKGLPAVAVNKVVLAGFEQDLVFNNQIPKDCAEDIATLFRSLYFDLSFVEIARLVANVQNANLTWFPVANVVSKLGWNYSESFLKTCAQVNALPFEFQQTCAEKKLNLQDFSPLLSLSGKGIFPLLQKMMRLRMTRQELVQGLELGIELLLMGKNLQDLDLSNDESGQQFSRAEEWLKELRKMRFPLAFKADAEMQAMIQNLPWPLTSSARLVRQGDKSGIEIKFTVSNAQEMRKKLNSLSKIQEILEKDAEWTKTKH